MSHQSNRHLSERRGVLGRARHGLREELYGFVKKLFGTDDGRRIAAGTLNGLLSWHPGALIPGAIPPVPYTDVGRTGVEGRPSDRADIVIITGRFRSGSTLLWNLFRNVDGFTSYYEPFNERRWFDPLTRGDQTDRTHKHVSNYWREYDGLGVLGEYYERDWAEKNLLMEETAWAPRMKRYVEILIEKSPGRPALQFNRVDFRLPWFRRNFPRATVVHIYRHPRDQWCSSLLGDLGRFPRDGSVVAFGPFDHFYLRMWASDLKYHFPFLDESAVAHPYTLFYYIWRLSYIFGAKYADRSIQFERLLGEPRDQISDLLQALGVRHYDLDRLRSLVEHPPLERWRDYADDGWFEAHESACEAVLTDFFGTAATHTTSPLVHAGFEG